MSKKSHSSTSKVQQQEMMQSEEITLTDDIVVSFLEDNPEFFNRHPELATSLRVSDQHRGTVSLVERQQQQLRQKIHGLEEEITQLMAIANQNEQLFTLYSDLYLRLIDCQSAEELLDCLFKATTELLSLTDMKLWLVAPGEFSHACLVEKDCGGILQNRLAKDQYYFGRIQQSEQEMIFSGQCLGSVVLIKLQHQQQVLGFLAISSQDAEHFDPRMDTLLLSQFRKLVAKLLERFLVNEA
ncbi:hypothetical protein tinsulaeT_17620 [Thalassotalea insulae]|uniref:DUF484 family protein n=1 Tax=Thalassotalea insulae TaxID=2056778 RepID=A0ABQ6GUU2_9GAMM|nr:DUF484 family protein [Thalassotalea insulae]GLX78422.1 hypothetical protein tinsulaeT_17620 [Thalassotalea insulae]